MRFGLWKYTSLVMQKYGHDESVPYAWRNVRNQFRGCFVCISLVDVALLQPVSNVVAIRSECIHVMFATCSLSVCYIFAV